MNWDNSSFDSLTHVVGHSNSSKTLGRDADAPAISPLPLFSTKVTLNILFVLNSILGLPLMSVGMICNILNIITLSWQGSKDTINISLTSLSVADLFFLLFSFWQTLCMIEPLQKTRWPVSFEEFSILTASLPRVYFARTSSCLTVFIAIERCISVTRPFHVKFILSRSRIVMAQLVIFALNLTPFILSYFIFRVSTKFDQVTNSTYTGVILIPGNKIITQIGLSYGVFLLFATFITITVCAIILVWTLLRQSYLRAKTKTWTSHRPRTGQQTISSVSVSEFPVPVPKMVAAAMEEEEGDFKSKPLTGFMADRDKRASKTVTILALMFITCYLPSVLFEIVITVEPEFSRTGRYRNAYRLFGLLGIDMQALCASANILAYYITSVKFREAFRYLFCTCRKTK